MMLMLMGVGCAWLAADPLEVPYEEVDLSIDARLAPRTGELALPGERVNRPEDTDAAAKKWTPVRKPVDGEPVSAASNSAPLIKFNQPGPVLQTVQEETNR